MPVNAFPTYRPIAVFLVALALANILYRYQAVEKMQMKLFKGTWMGSVFYCRAFYHEMAVLLNTRYFSAYDGHGGG